MTTLFDYMATLCAHNAKDMKIWMCKKTPRTTQANGSANNKHTILWAIKFTYMKGNSSSSITKNYLIRTSNRHLFHLPFQFCTYWYRFTRGNIIIPIQLYLALFYVLSSSLFNTFDASLKTNMVLSSDENQLTPRTADRAKKSSSIVKWK